MPVFLAAIFLKRLDFSVGLAEQRSYILTPWGRSIVCEKEADPNERSFYMASVVVDPSGVNTIMYLSGNIAQKNVVFRAGIVFIYTVG